MMKIVLNGSQTETSAETIAALLESIGINPSVPGTAVALNERVVPRSNWRETSIRDGDVVEVIRAVQGGS